MNQIVQQIKTMSSVEIAELTGKRHDHVMRDIRAMLDEIGEGGPSFGGTYLDKSNRESPCFNLPQDETICLMTGYDAKARIAIIKRWQELEFAPAVRIPRATAPKLPVMVAAGMVPGLARALRALGISPNAAAIGANQIATKETGANLLALAGHQHLVTPTQQICYTPTELGSRFVQSAKAFNRRLADAGLQESIVGHWVPTEKGQPYAVVLDTGKAHGSGAPIQQVKWLDSVLGEVAL